MSQKILEKEDYVSIAYRLMDRDGNPIDQFTKEEPFGFVLGYHQILPAVEEQLYSKEVGESLQIIVPAEEAYGKYRDDLVTIVDKEHFANEFSIKVGMRFSTKGPLDEDVIVEVIEVKDDEVVLDGNHPLAGLDLIFEIDIIEARKATKKELDEARAIMPKTQLH